MGAPWTKDPDPTAHLRLICLPYAGGGTVEYRQWQPRVPTGVQVCPVVLPGRESRLSEAPLRDMDALVTAMLPAVAALTDRPYALFGHSMGAWVAFELARALRRRGCPAPVRLFASGRRAPDVPDRLSPIHSLDDTAFLAALQARYQAIPPQLLAQREILALFLPALRADFALIERYTHRPEAPLAVPVEVWAGMDDALVTDADLDAWSAHSTAPVRRMRLAGGHFYPREHRDATLAAVLEALS
jgi:medium-chain acyl-[acyl-carrier-protein] hydrolase